MVDRPQRFSSLCPTVYGFVPQTYCGVETAQRCMDATGLKDIVGKFC
jgi:inorganic pyrophosphatase